MSKLNEGTWALPKNKEERETQGTIFIDKIEDLKTEIYPIIGDDILLDCFDNAIKRIEELVATPDSEISESVNESIQITDKVKYKDEKGFVIGQIENKFIVQIQGNTYLVDPKDLKEYGDKPEELVKPHMKFDEKTQALLFEQYVRCGVFSGNIPIKTNNCYVKYNLWESANPEQQIKVIVDGSSTFIPKSQLRILDDINEFANADNYVAGTVIDEESEAILENVLLNVIDYSNAVGDADSVRIIKTTFEGEQEMQSVPKSMVRILTIE